MMTADSLMEREANNRQGDGGREQDRKKVDEGGAGLGSRKREACAEIRY